MDVGHWDGHALWNVIAATVPAIRPHNHPMLRNQIWIPNHRWH